MLDCFTRSEITEIETKAIGAGLGQELLMENAGKAIATEIDAFITSHKKDKLILLLAGKGNNGGDGYVAGSYLLKNGYKVIAYEVHKCADASLCHKQQVRFLEAGGILVKDLHDLPTKSSAIVDAIWGIGFTDKPDEAGKRAISWMNASKIPIISIDIPSGLDATTGKIGEVAVIATVTITINFAKTGFFFENGWNFVGAIIPVAIGLESFTSSHKAQLKVLEESDVLPLLPPLVRNRHKYTAGHIVGIGGMSGMQGASTMAAWAALRSGAGIVHILQDEKNIDNTTSFPLEVVKIPYKHDNYSPITDWMHKAGCVFIGPGFGTTQEQIDLFEHIYNDLIQVPAIIDADALNILSLKRKASGHLNIMPHAICTPHLGEMQRLLGTETKELVSLEFIQKVHRLTCDLKCHLVLKGAPSFLFSPQETPLVMTRGSPGMATAGSGDVLTGILAAIYAQKKDPQKTMIFGTYLHALAGEAAAINETAYAMTATSIITHLPEAWHYLLQN